jgi:hypothetical protein
MCSRSTIGILKIKTEMNGQSDDLEINLTFRPLGEKLDLIEGCLLFRVYLDNFSKKSNIF